MIKRLYLKVKEWIKTHQFVIFVMVNLPFLIFNILLLFVKAEYNLSMHQSQTQSMYSQTQNVNNNQNINLNITGNSLYGTRLTAKAVRIKRTELDTFVKTLAYYQQLGLALAVDGEYIIVVHPIVTNKKPVNMPITYTNYSTNYQNSAQSNISLWNFFR